MKYELCREQNTIGSSQGGTLSPRVPQKRAFAMTFSLFTSTSASTLTIERGICVYILALVLQQHNHSEEVIQIYLEKNSFWVRNRSQGCRSLQLCWFSRRWWRWQTRVRSLLAFCPSFSLSLSLTVNILDCTQCSYCTVCEFRGLMPDPTRRGQFGFRSEWVCVCECERENTVCEVCPIRNTVEYICTVLGAARKEPQARVV